MINLDEIGTGISELAIDRQPHVGCTQLIDDHRGMASA